MGLPALSPDIRKAGFLLFVKSLSGFFFLVEKRDSRAGLSPFVFWAFAEIPAHRQSTSKQTMQASDAEI
jgi:hypothetical protein